MQNERVISLLIIVLSVSVIAACNTTRSASRDSFNRKHLLIDDQSLRIESVDQLLYQSDAEKEEVVRYLIVALKKPESTQRAYASEALIRINEKAHPAIDALIEALDEEKGAPQEAGEALFMQFSKAVPALLQALEHPNASICRQAAWTLSRIYYSIDSFNRETPELRKKVVRAVLSAMKNTDAKLRENASLVLARIDVSGLKAEDGLIEALTDPNPDVRQHAVKALGTMRCADASKPILNVLKTDEDYGVLDDAGLALGRIAPKDPLIIEGLIGLLEHEKVIVRKGVCSVLANVGEAAAPAIPGLIKSTSDSDSIVRERAVYALGTLGATEPSALAAIEKIIFSGNRDQYLRMVAIGRLPNIGSRAIPTLVRALEHNDSELAVDAASKLSWLKAEAESALPALRKAALNENKALATAAQRSITSIEAAIKMQYEAAITRGGMKELLEILGKHDSKAIERIVTNISRDEAKSLEAISTLAKLVHDKNNNTAIDAMMAISGFKRNQEHTAKLLASRLNARNKDVQRAAIDALVRIGQPSMKALQRRYTHKKGLLQANSLEAMSAIDPDNAHVYTQLLQALTSTKRIVREKALALLYLMTPKVLDSRPDQEDLMNWLEKGVKVLPLAHKKANKSMRPMALITFGAYYQIIVQILGELTVQVASTRGGDKKVAKLMEELIELEQRAEKWMTRWKKEMDDLPEDWTRIKNLALENVVSEVAKKRLAESL